MSIRPVQEKWTIHVKGLTGEKHSFTIEKDSTVRKLYRQVRKTLKATSSIKIILETGMLKKDIPKSDEKISTVGITNNSLLYVIVEQVPDMFKVTLNFSAPIGTRSIYIAENKSAADLFQEVKNVIAKTTESSVSLPIIGLLCGDIPVKENRSTLLQGEIFDGIELNVQLVMMTVLINLGNKVCTVNISPAATIAQIYQKVGDLAPQLKSNQKLRLLMGKIELSDYSTQSLQDAGIHHGSTLYTVIRTVGGDDPRIKLLLECKEKVIAGVKTPSMRACPHCGAIVEHTDACKHMKCPACSKEFCFICLSKRDDKGRPGGQGWFALFGQTGWQCGRYNAPCASAPRQTNIPGPG